MGNAENNPKGIVAVLLSGRGSNFVSILEKSRQIDANYTISLVISDNAAAPGLLRARQEGLNAHFVDPQAFSKRSQYEQAICRLLTEHRIELVCLAGYMRRVGKTLLGAYPDRILNIHPSLLPSFPGLNAQRQALEWGAKVSGCTVHFVDSGMDSGPIFLQQPVPVLTQDDEAALSERILAEEHRLFPLAISLYFSKQLVRKGRTIQVR